MDANLQDSVELATQHDKRCITSQSFPVFMIQSEEVKNERG